MSDDTSAQEPTETKPFPNPFIYTGADMDIRCEPVDILTSVSEILSFMTLAINIDSELIEGDYKMGYFRVMDALKSTVDQTIEIISGRGR